MNHSLLSWLLFFFSTTAYAAPFGLEMGEPLAELSKKMTLEQGQAAIYNTESAPKPHPDFNKFTLVITPAHGLCKILAFSRTMTTNVYGVDLLGKFNELEKSLSIKYGQPKRLDYLEDGSIWHEPREWMMSLLKGERTLTSVWLNDKRELPDNVRYIKLKTMAFTQNSGLISLTYEFNNANQCLDYLQSQKNSNL